MSRFFTTALLTLFLVATTAYTNGSHQQSRTDNANLAVMPPTMPVRVSIGVMLLRVFSIESPNTEQPTIKARFRIRTEWRDERLASWTIDESEMHEYQDDDARAQLARMFNPGIEVVDGETEAGHLHLRIFRHGLVSLSQMVDVTVPANMSLTHFPFDCQIFAFRFASAYWSQQAVDLSANSLESGSEDTADKPEQWHFGLSSYYISKLLLGEHNEHFATFNFLLYAERDPQYFIWRLLIPLLAMVLLSWNVFWMFEDASSAFSNCIVFLLTVVAFHQIANEMLPVISDFTFLDSIVFLSYGFIIIPTFQVMVASKLEFHGKTKQAAEIRRICRWLVPTVFCIAMLTVVLIYFTKPM